jgi:hypothetical protein
MKEKYIRFVELPTNIGHNSFLESIKFDHVISLEFNCNSPICINSSGNRYYKLPFDWMQASFDNYKLMIKHMKNKTLNTQVHWVVNDKLDQQSDVPKFLKI